MKHIDKPTIYAERLHQLRKENGLSQEELGHLLGVQKTAIYKYEKGLTSIPQNKIAKICDIFGVPADYLLGRSNEAIADFKKFIKIKLYDKWTIDGPQEAKESEIGYEITKEEIKKGKNAFFAIKYIGESMSPFYMDNDIVIIEKSSDFNTGQDILLTIGKSDAIIRKCSKEPNGILIKATNTIFPTQFFNFDEMASLPINILGKVRQIIRKVN